MKAGGRGSTGERSAFGLRRALVVSQVALSMVLLFSAMLFVRSLRNLLHVETGFRQEGILLVDCDFSRLKLPPERRPAFQLELLEKVRGLPGIESAAAASIVPLTSSSWSLAIEADGSTETKKRASRISAVSPEYFRVMENPLLAGRYLEERDSATGRRVAVVTEAFAKMFFPQGNPVGRTFRTVSEPGEPQTNYEVVGVVKDTKYRSLRETFRPLFFISAAQNNHAHQSINLMIRSSGATEGLTKSIARAITDVRSDISVTFQRYDQLILDSLSRDRLMAVLAGVFGALAAILAVIGLYGVLAYTVARRRAEIGIRMALGADGSSVIRMILRDAGGMLIAGLVVGILLAVVVGQTAQSLLYGLSARDPLTIAVAAASLAGAALFASYLPARRAAGLDPMIALREE